MTALIKKEIRAYFTSFTGYIFLAGFIFLMGLFFYMFNIAASQASFVQTLSNPSTFIAFLILMPILTMQLFTEETKQHTDQLLYTAPITITQIVIGKYIGALLLFLTGIIVTLVFPVIISFYAPVSFSETFGAYLGFVLVGASFISVGMLSACLTNNTIVAAIGAFSALFLIYVLDAIAVLMPTDRFSSAVFLIVIVFCAVFIIYDATKNIIAALIFGFAAIITGVIIYQINPVFYDATILRILNWFSVLRRFRAFSLGIFAVSDMVYYLAFCTAFIYLTINTIEKRRWK